MIIGLNGLKGAGKDTVADYLVDQYGFHKWSFADSLKDSVCGLFGITRAELEEMKNDSGCTVQLCAFNASVGIATFTMREFLQRYGTEAHRNVFGSDFWIKQYPGFRIPVVIPDARFENELDMLRMHNAINVRIVRDTVNDGDTHESEALPAAHLIDYLIDNCGTIEELYAEVEHMLFKIGENSVG